MFPRLGSSSFQAQIFLYVPITAARFSCLVPVCTHQLEDATAAHATAADAMQPRAGYSVPVCTHQLENVTAAHATAADAMQPRSGYPRTRAVAADRFAWTLPISIRQ